MSRLLFAAALGARIQINGFTATVPSWYDSHKWSSMHESVLRIHPEDEHHIQLREALEQVRLDLKDTMKLLREQVISPLRPIDTDNKSR